NELVGLVLDDGSRINLDVCLVGIGLAPNTQIAEDADLRVDDGIVVDRLFRTDDPSIFAIGDVARFPDDDFGSLRLESIPNSTDHARALADSLTGNPKPYEAVPWFWSDQYDLKLQAVGMAVPGDTVVVRGDPDHDRAISVFYLRDGEVRAAEVVSNPRDFAMAKRLVSQRAKVDPSGLADSAVSLKSLMATASART
ncbi:oxidoreductase C-terminal domain-containing protein, partial [Bacillus cereus]|uniref:oxidoreductase C-terminal domain-containing protein n=1 Tax=Bacillus cereus TaxID=1396 RepID=UPI003636784F